MPLFGKKKDAEKKKAAEAMGSSSGAYPRQEMAPGAPPAYPVAGGPPSGAPPAYTPHPQQYGAPQLPQPGASITVVVPDAFDAGARFGAGAQPSIPPPPPGVMPNMAQMAVAQGNNVVVGQKKETVMGGTGDGGYVVW